MGEQRTVEQVRAELASERELLAQEAAALRAEARAALPYALGGVAALLVLTKGRGLTRALGLLRFLR